MDPNSFHANSSNGYRSEIQSNFVITYPGQSLPFDYDSSSEEMLRYIDWKLMDEDTYALQPSLNFQAKNRCFLDALYQKYPSQDENNFYYYFNNTNLTTSIRVASGFLIDREVDPSLQSCNNSSVPYCKLLDINEAAVGFDELPEEFDDDDVCDVYTLGGREKDFTACFTDLKIEANKKQLNGKKKKKKQKTGVVVESVDLKSLLMNCSKSVASDDHRAAFEYLRQIREQSSPIGDGNQRLAHYFANGIEARLAGESPVTAKPNASDTLRVFCVSLMCSCIRKVSDFASNKLIATKSKKSSRVHVVDFGISHGFQWPLFIRRLGGREGGPPKLRITGVDFPEEKIEETGSRLARYARAFGVPFEYNTIACDWEGVRVEDLKIEEGEFVAVNCLYGCKKLRNEKGDSESSKSRVLELIKRINPDIFVHGIVNGGYGVPFFSSRFREALYYFSALFDMVDTVVPRERPERMVIERDMFGHEIMNVIACEGAERVEWPETYKQWQFRHLAAGFRRVRFGKELIDTLMSKVGSRYNGNFVVDEDSKWLLLSWKGRITHAISCWQPSKHA